MEKLNICLANDSFPPCIDGVSNAVANYAKIINAGPGSASVTTPNYPGADDSVFDFPVIRYPSFDLTRLCGYRAGYPFSVPVMEKLEASGFDLIHSHCPVTATMLARALRDRINKPIVFTYHTKFDIDIANTIKSKPAQNEAVKLLVKNVSACDEVWTVSRGAGENLKSLGFEGDYIVMPNGVDLPKGRVEPDVCEKVSEGLDLPHGVPLFLFVGRMMWYKGIKIILDALASLKSEGTDFRMVFVGSGADKEEIQKYSANSALSDKVFFVDAIHDREVIRAWYCRADLFLFPSTFDTNGLVVREAAACALPSVLVKGSCAAEDIKEGYDGFLIEENSASLAQTLKSLISQPGAVKLVGSNAQRSIYMSWDDAVKNAYERYFTVCDEYASGKKKRKETFSDEFYSSLSKAMENISKIRSRSSSAVEQISADYSEFRDELKMGLKQTKKDIEEFFDRNGRYL